MKALLPLLLTLAALGVTDVATAQTQLEKSPEGSQNVYKSKPDEPKTYKENDLILIVVRERTLANVDQDLQADRKTEYSLAIDQFIRITDGKNISPAEGPFPGVEADAELKTQGRGQVKRNDRLEARVQARVVDVLPNGNLRLEARRERRIGDETTVITLSGVAPGKWIAIDDTVPSDRLADLKISYRGHGPVSARTGSTWLCTVLDWIWPF